LRIDVHSGLDIGVAQEFLLYGHVRPSLVQDGREGVAERMSAPFADTRSLRSGFDVVRQHDPVPPRLAVIACENVIVLANVSCLSPKFEGASAICESLGMGLSEASVFVS
jgi:hypothetical protein